MVSFREKWLEAVEKKDSVLCAGLDPAEYGMGREECLPFLADKREWSFRYLEAVAPYAAAVKTNINYWKKRNDMQTLSELANYAFCLGLVIIDDSKLADIGSTNDAGMYYSSENNFDAVTLAPFAGNMKEAAEQARKREIGLISMCLMSNSEYERVKKQWVQIDNKEDCYYPADIVEIEGVPHVKKYTQLAHDAAKYGIDGIVIGAPSEHNHLKEKEIFTARQYSRDDTLVLLPGIGAQDGEAEIIWKYFNRDSVIVNIGRALMFPKGSNSSQKEQGEAAKYYRDMLNNLRGK